MNEDLAKQDEIRKQEIINTATDIDFLSYMPTDEEALKGKKRIPLAEIATLGMFFQPLVQGIQSMCGGDSGLYYVNAKGGNLVRRKNGTKIGAIARGNNQVGGGSAELTPVKFTPEMVSQCCMAVALLDIEHRISEIQKTQDEILAFMEEKDRYMLKGGLYFLVDILSNYKYNFDNKQYTEANHIKILDVKESAEQSILLYSNKIKNIVEPNEFFHIDSNVKDKLKKLQAYFKSYQIAIYNYAFSSFLDVILVGNFEAEYLDKVIEKIDKYSLEFRDTYTTAYNKLEAYNDNAVDTLAIKGAGEAASKLANGIGKVKNLDKLSSKLKNAGKMLNELNADRKDERMQQVIANRTNYALPFKKAIEYIRKIYNTEFKVIVSEDSLYIDSDVA